MDTLNPLPDKRHTLLVVDDERLNITILLELLKPTYGVIVATSGEVALQRARSATPPDLILLDIMMPGMDGYEVCRRLKADATTRDIPVIFVTAINEVSAEAKGLELGAVDYITKPISPPIVLARVKTHLNLRMAYQELQQRNIELIKADQLKQDVDRIVRHDLRSPLNGVIGFSELMLEDEGCSAEYRKHLGIIRNCGMKALHMINLSLGLYRMEQGNYQLEPHAVNLVQVINTIQDDLTAWLRGSGLTVVIRGAALSVLGEEMLCYSVLANLIKNALEASPTGQTVTIALEDRGAVGRVTIHNQGAVPAQIRDRFFEKYVTAGKNSGTGLGTYSARLMVETMGGQIWMNSAEASGTEIIIDLPRGV
ncbi:MAG: hybrid sensor histidine kinase/response regulator [Magnetococcales bacterium]|nr:hybrid sensor histidine kinase/response regulator [Magnetococcales bacterium]